MAFVVTIDRERGMKHAPGADCFSASSHLAVCAEGRKLSDLTVGCIRVAIDEVPHDCRSVRLRRAADQAVVVIGVIFGWCSELAVNRDAEFGSEALARLVGRLRNNIANPEHAIEGLTGNYCMLIFDIEAARSYVMCDKWAVRGFYYGISSNRVVVSSRAAVVAASMGAPIDGMAWMALMRGTQPPAQVSIFRGVRASCLDKYSLRTMILEKFG
jgi:hypothetical protein